MDPQNLLTKRNIITLIIVAVILIALPLGLYLSQKTQIFKPRAAEPSSRSDCTISGPSSLTAGQQGVYAARVIDKSGNNTNIYSDVQLCNDTNRSNCQAGNFIYEINNPGWKTYPAGSSFEATWTPQTPGTYDVFCRAVIDGVWEECRPDKYAGTGNKSCGASSIIAVTVNPAAPTDTLAPSATISISPSSPSYTAGQTVTLNFSGSDTGANASGVKVLHLTIWPGAAFKQGTSSYEGFVGSSGSKTTTIPFYAEVTAEDNAHISRNATNTGWIGNVSQLSSAFASATAPAAPTDTLAPSATISISPSSPSYTAGQTVTLNFSGSDTGANASGVKVLHLTIWPGAAFKQGTSSYEGFVGSSGSKTTTIPFYAEVTAEDNAHISRNATNTGWIGNVSQLSSAFASATAPAAKTVSQIRINDAANLDLGGTVFNLNLPNQTTNDIRFVVTYSDNSTKPFVIRFNYTPPVTVRPATPTNFTAIANHANSTVALQWSRVPEVTTYKVRVLKNPTTNDNLTGKTKAQRDTWYDNNIYQKPHASDYTDNIPDVNCTTALCSYTYTAAVGNSYTFWIDSLKDNQTSDIAAVIWPEVIVFSSISPPTNVSAACLNGIVELRWSKVAGASSYEVRGGRDLTTRPDDSTWDRLPASNKMEGTGLTVCTASHCYFKDSRTKTGRTIAPGESYFLWVHSNDSSGKSGQPKLIEAPITCGAPIQAPTNVSATCTNGNLNVTWTGPGAAAKYRLRAGKGLTQDQTLDPGTWGTTTRPEFKADNSMDLEEDNNTSGTFSRNVGANGQSYIVWVHSENSQGGLSDRAFANSGNPITCSAAVPPATPTNFTYSVTSANSTVTLQWTKISDVNTYIIRGLKNPTLADNSRGKTKAERDAWYDNNIYGKTRAADYIGAVGTSSHIPNISCTTTPCSYTYTAEKNTPYTFWIDSFKDGLTSDVAAVIWPPITTQPPKPTSITGACSNNQLYINWTAVAGATYRLRVDKDPINGSAEPTNDTSWNGSKTSPLAGDSASDNEPTNSKTVTVVPGAKYQVWVQSDINNNPSDITWSSEISCPATTPPPPPTPVSAFPGCNGNAYYMELRWSDPAEANSYDIAYGNNNTLVQSGLTEKNYIVRERLTGNITFKVRSSRSGSKSDWISFTPINQWDCANPPPTKTVTNIKINGTRDLDLSGATALPITLNQSNPEITGVITYSQGTPNTKTFVIRFNYRPSAIPPTITSCTPSKNNPTAGEPVTYTMVVDPGGFANQINYSWEDNNSGFRQNTANNQSTITGSYPAAGNNKVFRAAIYYSNAEPGVKKDCTPVNVAAAPTSCIPGRSTHPQNPHTNCIDIEDFNIWRDEFKNRLQNSYTTDWSWKCNLPGNRPVNPGNQPDVIDYEDYNIWKHAFNNNLNRCARQ